MTEKLKQLYKSVILKHNKTPYHYEKQPAAAHNIEAYNPLCGDQFNLYLDLENGLIKDIHFHGYGCAISKASTSVLVKNLENKSIEEALELCRIFKELTDPSEAPTKDVEIKELEAFEAAKDFPSRLSCATLSWEAIKIYLEKEISEM